MSGGGNCCPIVLILTTSSLTRKGGITSLHVNKSNTNQSWISAGSCTVYGRVQCQLSCDTPLATAQDNGGGILHVSREACASPCAPSMVAVMWSRWKWELTKFGENGQKNIKLFALHNSM